MNFYQNHDTVVKSKSVYKKSFKHLACQAMMHNGFLCTLERSENRLGWSINEKMFLVHDPLYLLENKSNSNWSLRRYKVWLETENYVLMVKGKKIFLGGTEWINVSIMNTVQKLICNALGRLESCQLVLNWQKRETLLLNIS